MNLPAGINKNRIKILTLTAILLPFLFAIANLVVHNLVLWYDPARDLLSAWSNLSKPTLLGPPSGIPGIFYGPYWIWLLSFGLFFSKDPLIVTFIAITLPYFILFPLIWFHFNKYFDRISLLICWLLFIFTSGIKYTTQLWNPYPATLFTIAVIYLLTLIEFNQRTKKQLLFTTLTGFFIGLTINFHISFGIALLCGTGFYFLTTLFLMGRKKQMQHYKNVAQYGGLLLLGIFATFIPTLLFEFKHGFHQIQTVIHALLKYGAVVQVQGMSKNVIFLSFFSTFGHLLYLQTYRVFWVIFVVILLFIYYKNKREIHFSKKDEKILLITFSLLAGAFFIYLTANNPIWPYHFIGVDVLFLPIIAFIITKLRIIKIISIIWTFVVIIVSFYSFFKPLMTIAPQLSQQEQVVNVIIHDAKNSDYSVFAYSPSIYIYEYSYLFLWLAHKNIPYDPGMIKSPADTVYLIVPDKMDPYIEDFIHDHTPRRTYREVTMLKTSGGIAIIKNIKK